MTKNIKIGLLIVLSFLLLAVFMEKKTPKQPIARKPPAKVIPKPIPKKKDIPPKEITFDDAVNSITAKEAKADLEYLASRDLEGRMSGKKGNIVALEYIKKKYESFGLPTMYHKFSIDRMNPGPNNETGDNFTQNVYAWIEGNDPNLKNEIIVVGAHADHIGFGPQMSRASGKIDVHPGADDNASGTVAILEMAQAFSMLKGKVKRTIVFQSYSAEEMGLIGSRYYCNNPTFPKNSPDIKKHVFMCNLDMVGWLGKGEYFAGFNSADSSEGVGVIIDELNKKYSFAKQITSRSSGGSDHASFYNKKIPIAFLHTGLHPYYHTPGDTADKINFEGIEKVARYGFELVWNIDQRVDAPKFNYGTFKEMDYTHDHGHPGMPFHHHPHK